ncbi:MAG: HNH endonuclease [Bacteroidetes bacterium]|nr:HNH endonuclease [Bacteroidota bacterium]
MPSHSLPILKFYIGNTDYDWFSFLSQRQPEDVNFWRPGGNTNFKVLSPGAPFLLKLKSPYNAIAGIGFFAKHTLLPVSFAWDTFQERNGCESFEALLKKISGYRRDWWDQNPQIGCTVLSNPIFFAKKDWIPAPENWANSIVQGKSYITEEPIGLAIWERVQLLLDDYFTMHTGEVKSTQLILDNNSDARYRETVLSKVRVGQGAFRLLLTDAYARRCAISGEKTLPVLEAAHIKPYALSGPHLISNGVLLRSDLHKLFDTGYITITQELKVEVSRRIKEEFQNGKEYYQYHGAVLKQLPNRNMDIPATLFTEWHNSNVFKG